MKLRYRVPGTDGNLNCSFIVGQCLIDFITGTGRLLLKIELSDIEYEFVRFTFLKKNISPKRFTVISYQAVWIDETFFLPQLNPVC